MLSGYLVVLQAPMFDGLLFDPIALSDDGFGSSEVDIGRGHVVEALVVAPMVVVLDEGLDLSLKVARQEVVLQRNTVLQGLMPAFDLALRLRMERGATHMAHTLGFDIVCQFAGDVARPIVTEQPGFVLHPGLITT